MLTNYDQWLTEPYERAQEDWEEFLDWAEDQGYDTYDGECLKLAEQAYEEHCAAEAEDAALAAYDDYQDRLYDEAQEMDDRYYEFDYEDCY